MNIQQQLAVTHSRANADLILTYVLADPDRTEALLAALRSADVPIAQRAAMVVGDLGRARPDWLHPYQTELLQLATEPIHAAVRRNVLRYFSELPLPDIEPDVEGPLLDLAFTLTESPQVPTGIRVFAMQVVANFAVRYPELRAEFRAFLEGELAITKSAGFRSRARHILRTL